MDLQIPSFVVIGAMKAGTTSLHAYLDLHREISMPFTIKEVNFFNRSDNWNRGISWYKSNFRLNNLKKGEVCPNYAMFPAFPEVPERMYSILPDARLIYILRDPIERMLSQIHHQLIDGRETREIAEIIADNTDRWHYRAYSMYYSQLEKFLAFYKKERILIVTLEMLNQSPQLVMSEVFSFLAVDSTFYSESFTRRYHDSSKKMSSGKFLKLINHAQLPKSLITVKSKVSKLIPRQIYKKLRQRMEHYVPKPQLTASQRAKLVSIFKDDVAKLRSFTGHDFEEWKHRY